jgi:hypothetical protein
VCLFVASIKKKEARNFGSSFKIMGCHKYMYQISHMQHQFL